MKRAIFFAPFGLVLALGLTLFVSLFASAAGGQEKAIVICSENQSFPPYTLGKSNQYAENNPGILVEIASAAIKEAGLKLQHIRRPWKRCLKLLEQNNVDGIFPSIFLQERKKIGRYPLKPGTLDYPIPLDPNRRLLRVTYRIYKKKDSPFSWDGTRFSGISRSIGAPLGYVVVKKLQEDHQIQANTAHTPSKGLRLVAEGNLDAYILETGIGRSLIEELNLGDSLSEITVPFAHYDWYMMISHNFYSQNPATSQKIWDAIGNYRKKHIQGLLVHYQTLP